MRNHGRPLQVGTLEPIKSIVTLQIHTGDLVKGQNNLFLVLSSNFPKMDIEQNSPEPSICQNYRLYEQRDLEISHPSVQNLRKSANRVKRD